MKKFIVFFAAIAMVGAFAFSAVAADWNFYGSSRVETYSRNVSKEVSTNPTGTYDDTDTNWGLAANARIGANVAAGDITGRFEWGGNFALRLLYGEWNFGSGKFLVGQQYALTSPLYSNQWLDAGLGLHGFGEIYGGRVPQLKLTFGDFQIALLQPSNAVGVDSTSTYGTLGAVDTDTTLPKIEAKYRFKTDQFFIDVVGGYNSTDVVGAVDKEYSVDSWVAMLGGGADFGPVSFKAMVYSAQNQATYGLTTTEATYAGAIYNGTNDSFEDSDAFGYMAMLGFKMSDMVKFEIGYGAVEQEMTINATNIEDNCNAYYLNATITLAPGVTINPEIGKLDYDDVKVGNVTTKQGDTTYFGATWKIDF